MIAALYSSAAYASAPEAFAAAWSELLAHHPCSAEGVYGAWAGVEPPDRVALAAEFLAVRGAAPASEEAAALAFHAVLGFALSLNKQYTSGLQKEWLVS